MKISLGAGLALSYLAVILFGMGIVTPLAWLVVERLYLNTQSASLLAQAELVAAALQNQAPVVTGSAPYSQASNTLPGIHTRVIDAQNAAVIDLVGTSELPSPTDLTLPKLAQNTTGLVSPAELLNRPEIAQALSGKPTTAIRRVEVAGGKRVLYAAAPVISGENTITQIVYLATPLPDTQWTALPVVVRWQFGAVFLCAILLASATGVLLARRISRPIGKLAQAAHAVAAGDLDQKVPGDPNIIELDVLGQAFNTMTLNLRQTDQAKTAFISDVSHELRTPLTVIKGTIETLQDGALDDPTIREPFLASMMRETERLIRLVNDLLVLTRADAGALNLHCHPVDLLELVRSRCNHFAMCANQRQVYLKITTDPSQVDPDDFNVQVDPDRIAQVLDNLLDNAIRYSPPGADVIVSLTRIADRVTCLVADSGPGIPAKHLPFIFERFYRADQARERSQGGSGLGLSIVRSLVEAHSGAVSASSVDGQGTTITFWLPSAQS
jgi:signal transduction histidine kinase